MKKLTGAIALAAAAALVLSACTSVPTTSGSPAPAGSESAAPAPGGDVKVAFVSQIEGIPYFNGFKAGGERAAKDLGITYTQTGPATTNSAEQVKILDGLVSQQFDAIAVSPLDPTSINSSMAAAAAAGVKMATSDADAPDSAREVFVSQATDAALGGAVMDEIAKAMGETGQFGIVSGGADTATFNNWIDAALARQKEKYPNMKLLEAEPRVESQDDGEVAYQKAKELMKKYPELKGIMGTSSFDAPGVARAIEELGLQGKFFTAGTGMPEANKQILEKGLVHALTLWDPADAGYAMAELARKVLDKEPLEEPINLGVKGYEEVKFAEGSKKVLEGAGWIVITKDNVGTFGF